MNDLIKKHTYDTKQLHQQHLQSQQEQTPMHPDVRDLLEKAIQTEMDAV